MSAESEAEKTRAEARRRSRRRRSDERRHGLHGGRRPFRCVPDRRCHGAHESRCGRQRRRWRVPGVEGRRGAGCGRGMRLGGCRSPGRRRLLRPSLGGSRSSRRAAGGWRAVVSFGSGAATGCGFARVAFRFASRRAAARPAGMRDSGGEPRRDGSRRHVVYRGRRLHDRRLRVDRRPCPDADGDRCRRRGPGGQAACLRHRQSREHPGVGEPCERGRETALAYRDREECADDVRVELRAGAPRELHPRLDDRGLALVRAGGGDHVEHVRDSDDPARQRDLAAGQAERIPRPVPPLVVLLDRGAPRAQPLPQRRGELGAGRRVRAEDLPLVLRRPAGVRQDLVRDLELADVVEQGRPVEKVELSCVEAELAPDALRVSTDAAPNAPA